mmetsp:Transcript_29194/g.94117  ORF Transcript_29194/g.94117 Transcript_29194/m.94117 type:complete len:214 (+) Transcript_29194:828-1469(+)
MFRRRRHSAAAVDKIRAACRPPLDSESDEHTDGRTRCTLATGAREPDHLTGRACGGGAREAAPAATGRTPPTGASFAAPLRRVTRPHWPLWAFDRCGAPSRGSREAGPFARWACPGGRRGGRTSREGWEVTSGSPPPSWHDCSDRRPGWRRRGRLCARRGSRRCQPWRWKWTAAPLPREALGARWSTSCRIRQCSSTLGLPSRARRPRAQSRR